VHILHLAGMASLLTRMTACYPNSNEEETCVSQRKVSTPGIEFKNFQLWLIYDKRKDGSWGMCIETRRL